MRGEAASHRDFRWSPCPYRCGCLRGDPATTPLKTAEQVGRPYGTDRQFLKTIAVGLLAALP